MPLASTARRRVRLRLRGIVQGVGFRPFIHNLASELRLDGFVLNSSSGLVAEVEGEPDAVDRFLGAVERRPPPLAWIQEKEVVEIDAAGEHGFTIRGSVATAGEFALVSPDVATCDACLEDVVAPDNRRRNYPFTNCTNCGPRYTIVRDIPYDRPNTTMAPFRMCPACQAEYDDPGNRRFHAQPNACPVCGPSLSGTIEEARWRLAAGEILAIKGLGGYHLACDARNAGAVANLRGRKRRGNKPFALMARDMAAIEAVCEASDADRAALTGVRRPIVIMPRKSSPLPEAIAPGNSTLGVMLPYTPLHHLLFEGAPYSLLVMTSGNLSEEPIVVDAQEAEERLGGIADWFLHHNRDIYMRADDSVVRTFGGLERVSRRSRGYAPETMDMGRELPELLACGGELKNAFCLTKGRHAILSQHIGDLENYETLRFFEETLANLQKLFRVHPCAVVHDLHPSYLSTGFAQQMTGVRKVGVQHHHAHIAACMAENGLESEVLGVAFDGTGYGADGAIWGGEFLAAGYRGFSRLAHLRYVPLPGGDAAIRHPWRSALAHLMDARGPDAELDWAPAGAASVRHMIATGLNTVPASSCGRLFDAVSAIAGFRGEVTFEGQAAIELESVADPAVHERYPFDLNAGSAWELDFRRTIAEVAADARRGEPPSDISARFHNTLTAAIVETCVRLRGQTGLKRVCLSGGTFQNMRLLGGVTAGLESEGFETFLHARVPPNDGGLALGQAAIAAELLK